MLLAEPICGRDVQQYFGNGDEAIWRFTSADAAHVHGPGAEDDSDHRSCARPGNSAQHAVAIFLRNHDSHVEM